MHVQPQFRAVSDATTLLSLVATVCSGTGDGLTSFRFGELLFESGRIPDNSVLPATVQGFPFRLFPHL